MRLKICQSLGDLDPSEENLDDLEISQEEYDRHYDYTTKGAISRSRANWYEHGEKSNKFFLNLEKSRNKKCVRKVCTDKNKDSCTSDPKEILDELKSFYKNLYDGTHSKQIMFQRITFSIQ